MTPRQKELFAAFIRSIVQAAGTMALYSKEHRMTIEQKALSLQLLGEALADDETATIMRLGDDLFVNGLPLDKGPQIYRLFRAMHEYGIGHITISRGAASEDIELLLLIITLQAGRDIQPTPHLCLGIVDVGIPPQPDSVAEGFPVYSSLPLQFIEGLAKNFDIHDNNEQLDLSSVLGVVAGFVSAFRKEANPFLALVPLREMDEYTFTHSVNVCILNLAQGMSLGFEGQLLHDLGVAGMLHDVGKQFVPDEVLNNPGRLNENEWEYMRQHAVRGAEYLLNNPGIPRVAILSAFEHHMKFDMSGYPKVPMGWQPNVCSQITALSDIFDALRTKRVYKSSMSFEKAAGIMLWLAGTELNPSLTLNFLKILRDLGEAEGGTVAGVQP